MNRNGLTATTLFYPGLLLRRPYEALPDSTGSLGNLLDGFRSVLCDALGIGRGSCLRADAPAGSRRGRIVALDPSAASYLQTPLAALLTQPEYSCAKRYHVILPIRPGMRLVGNENILRMVEKPWFAAFRQPVDSVQLPVQVVQSVWYEARIAGETDHVLDEESLAEIDRALCRYFSLPE